MTHPSFSWLDFKIGLRMLLRYPGLTVIGTVSMAVAIALGSVYFESITQFKNPRLPIRDGDRVVSILNTKAQEFGSEAPSLHAFAIWREQLKTVDHLGAAITFVRNLATEDTRVEPARGAEISASAFRVMGTAPLLGRVLTERDERPAEPPVVVISHTLWETRFETDPAVLGRTVKLGTVTATIVGVMPEGFAFPESQHIWMPLRVNGSTLAPSTGPAVSVFGRLASGASIEEAQAELDVIGRRMAISYPQTHEHLRPRLIPYGKPIFEGPFFERLLNLVHGIFLMLLAVICVNIATLVFARTATRGWEMAVRNALGASRGRIVTQLFAEALMLASVAAVFGLFVAKILMRFRLSLLGGNEIPFWIDDRLSWTTMLYAALLTLFGAVIVGVLPALRITKLNVQQSLRSENAAGAALRFGGFWTTVIVVQVTITVAFLPLAAGGIFDSNRFAQRAEAIGAERYITANVGRDREDHVADSAAFDARSRASLVELERRLSAEPGVERIAFADRLPVMDPSTYQIELDRMTGAPTTGIRASTLVHVSRGFFPAFGTSVVAGRDFEPHDFETGRVLIVNESFTRHVFGGRNPIGQRIRIVSGDVDTVVDIESVVGEEWCEIVGMVKDFGWQSPLPHEQSAMYRPSLPLVGRADHLVVRVRDPDAFAARLRTVAAAVDPTIRLTNVQGLADVGGATLSWTLTSVALLITFMVLLLSATGIHSLMSFTVARRTREIGIRVALGAGRGRIVTDIFSRALLQISAGVLAGSGLAALMGLGSMRQVLLLVAADAVMLVVGLAACALPLRRALRIAPTEALRVEG
jgi:predicted permease